jgi:O-antigen/teichoic acid export membrane protein
MRLLHRPDAPRDQQGAESGAHEAHRTSSSEPGRAPVAPTGGALTHALSWVGAGHVGGQAFWFGSLIVLAALLPPQAFGMIALGLLLVTAATRLMEAGTRGAIIVAPTLTRRHLTTALARNVGVGLLLSAAIAVLAGPMVDRFASGGSALVLAVLGLSVALNAPSIVPLALLEKHFQFKRRASVQAAATITASTLAVLAGLLGAGVWALVVRQLLFQALLALLGWLAARRLLPAHEENAPALRWERLKRHGGVAFMLFSLTDFVVFNADYLTVGHFTDARQLGLYSLAFTIAFAPMTQFSAQLGRVMFPAAASSDAETIRRRTVAAVRLTCLVLFPLIPIAIVLAPVVFPAVLGERWSGMVVPFQILIVVGTAHAIVNIIGESLSGTGHIGFRAWLNVVWMLAMIPALIVLVRADGIRGAAFAHLLLYAPVAVAYGVWGMRLLGARPGRLGSALRSVGVLMILQAVLTAAVVVALGDTGMPTALRGAVAAGVGLLAGVAYLVALGRGALSDARALLVASRRGT